MQDIPRALHQHPELALQEEKTSLLIQRELTRLGVVAQGLPSLGGEDFSFYRQQIPVGMICFGAAEAQSAGAAHSSRFDFDEQVLPYGAEWLATVAEQGLKYLQQQAAKRQP